MAIKDYFIPSKGIMALRSNQIYSLDEIEKLLNAGNKRIILEAPVGTGKTKIADTLFNYFNSMGIKCIYTSPLNTLVDQVEESGFRGFHTLKGREHYRCIEGKKNCSVGYCTIDKCPSGDKKRNCKAHAYSYCARCRCSKCLYRERFNAFRKSDKANTNFALFLMGITNEYKVIVIDESDQMEDSVRNFKSVTIPKLIGLTDFKDHIEYLKAYEQELYVQIEAIPDSVNDEKLKERNTLNRLCENIAELLYDYETYHEDYVVMVHSAKQKTKYIPVTVDRFIDPLLKDKTVIMMSATPKQYPGYHKIIVDSIFPIESRQWYVKPVGSMIKKNRDVTIPRLAAYLATLKGKTIVHCISYDTASKINMALRQYNKFALLQVNGDSEDVHTVKRYDAVSAFVSSVDPDKILLSVKLDRGIDLWQPEIINNIIAVMPFKNPTEPLTKARRALLGRQHENEEMAGDIAQMMGRIFRNEKMGIYAGKPVPKRGQIVCSDFKAWYHMNKKYFPKSFVECEIKI